MKKTRTDESRQSFFSKLFRTLQHYVFHPIMLILSAPFSLLHYGFYKMLEDRFDRSVKYWTWERFGRIDRSVKYWTWERFGRISKKMEKNTEYWTWERYNRTKNDISQLQKEVDKTKQDLMELLFLQKRAHFSTGRKIKAVMLFQIPSCWPSNESVWNAMSTDDRFDLTMLLYDREQKEPAQMAGAREFLIEHSIPFVDAENYEFATEHPDIIIYQTPWDNQHRPDFLRSDAMKRLGIRTVYLPYGIEYSASVRLSFIFSIMQFNAKPWLSFSLSPAVRMDHKLMSKYGADYLEVTGYPKFDSLYNRGNHRLEPELLDLIGNRKIIFWQTHFPALNGDTLYPIPDLRIYLDFARRINEYQDMFFLFRPHPKFFEVYEKNGYSEQVEEMRTILASLDNVYAFDAPDYRPALLNADCIIGDRSALMVEAIVLNIPTLYMTNFYHKEKMLPSIAPIFDSYYQGSDCYDIIHFLNMVIRDNHDYKQEERLAAKKQCIPYFDGKCGKRIVDAIVKKLEAEG